VRIALGSADALRQRRSVSRFSATAAYTSGAASVARDSFTLQFVNVRALHAALDR
jgi:hypothetical protein